VSGAPHRPPPWPRFWRGRLLCARLLYWRYGWDSKDTRLTSRSLLAGRSRVFGACRCQVVGAGLRLWLEEILGVLAGFLDLFAIAMSVRRPFCQQELLQSKSLTRGIMIAGKAARQETKRRKLIARRRDRYTRRFNGRFGWRRGSRAAEPPTCIRHRQTRRYAARSDARRRRRQSDRNSRNTRRV